MLMQRRSSNGFVQKAHCWLDAIHDLNNRPVASAHQIEQAATPTRIHYQATGSKSFRKDGRF
jgi:hypothetical protein